MSLLFREQALYFHHGSSSSLKTLRPAALTVAALSICILAFVITRYGINHPIFSHESKVANIQTNVINDKEIQKTITEKPVQQQREEKPAMNLRDIGYITFQPNQTSMNDLGLSRLASWNKILSAQSSVTLVARWHDRPEAWQGRSREEEQDLWRKRLAAVAAAMAPQIPAERIVALLEPMPATSPPWDPAIPQNRRVLVKIPG